MNNSNNGNNNYAFGTTENQYRQVQPYGGDLSADFFESEYRNSTSSGNAFSVTYNIPLEMERVVRLIPGQYHTQIRKDNDLVDKILPYFSYRRHWNQRTQRFVNCSAGPWYGSRAKANKCIGCMMYFEQKSASKQDKSFKTFVGSTTQYLFNIYDYGMWIKTQKMNSNNQPIFKQSGEPFMVWTPVDDRDIRLSQNFEVKQGNFLTLAVGYTQLQSLLNYDRCDVNKYCKSCGTGQILPLSRNCKNCDSVVLDYTHAQGVYANETIRKFESEPIVCPSCNHRDFLKAKYTCSQCPSPVKTNIFDVDLLIRYMRSPQLQNAKDLIVVSHSPARPPQFNPDIGPIVLQNFESMNDYMPHTLQQQIELFNPEPRLIAEAGAAQQQQHNAPQPPQHNHNPTHAQHLPNGNLAYGSHIIGIPYNNQNS